MMNTLCLRKETPDYEPLPGWSRDCTGIQAAGLRSRLVGRGLKELPSQGNDHAETEPQQKVDRNQT